MAPGRRSSILKQPKARNPLSDLDMKASAGGAGTTGGNGATGAPGSVGDDDGTTVDRIDRLERLDRNKRVSFAHTQEIALFRMADDGNTIFNVFEEANRIDNTGSSEGSQSRLQQLSVADKTPVSRLDTTFSHNADDEDEDHCVMVGASDALPSNPLSFADKTEDLINFKMSGAPVDRPETGENNINDSEMSITQTETIPVIEDANPLKNIAPKAHSTFILPHIKGEKINWIQDKENILSEDIDEILEIKLNPKTRDKSFKDEAGFDNKDNFKDITNQEQIINISNIKSSAEIFDHKKSHSQQKQSEVSCIDKIDNCNLSSISAPPAIIPPNHADNDDKSKQSILDFVKVSNENFIPTQDKENLKNDASSSMIGIPKIILEHSTSKIKRHTQIFDQNNPDGDMSMTVVNDNANMDNSILKNKRRTQIFNQNEPEGDMSMTIAIVNPNIEQSLSKNKRRTQIFEHNNPEGDMSMTIAINNASMDHYIPNNKRRTQIFDQNNHEANMSMTLAIDNTNNEYFESKNKRHTQIFDQNHPEGDMSMTMAIDNIKMDSTISKNKRHTQIFDKNNPEGDMSMTIAIDNANMEYSISKSKRHTQIFDQNNPDGNMSITMAVDHTTTDKSPNKKKHDPHIYDQEKPERKMSMTYRSNNNDLNTSTKQTQIIDENTSNRNLSFAGAIDKSSIILTNRRPTEIYDENRNGEKISLKNNNDKIDNTDLKFTENNDFKKSILSFAQVTTSQIINQNTSKNNFLMKDILTINHSKQIELNMEKENMVEVEINRRHTQVFSQNSPESDMSMTHVIPSNNKSMNVDSSHLPVSESRESDNLIVNQNKPENDSSLSHIKPSKNMSMRVKSSMDKENIVDLEINRRHTQVFSQNSPESDMSMTHVIPCSNKSANVESCNLPILECWQSNTSIVNQNMPENDSSLSHIVPSKNISMRVESSMDKENIVDMEINRRHTQVFSQNSPRSDMSMTHVTSSNNKSMNVESCHIQVLESRQSHTPIVIQNKPENDSSLSHFDPMKVESSMDKENIVEMEIDRRHTQVFSQNSPESDMSITHVIPCNNKSVNVESCNLPILESRKSNTPIVNQNKPENDSSLSHIKPSKNMSMRVESSMDKEDMVEVEINRRHTQVFSQNSPESDMSMIHVIPSNNKSMNVDSCHLPVSESRESDNLIVNQNKPENDSSLSHIKPTKNMSMRVESSMDKEDIVDMEINRRHTQVFSQDSPRSDMSMTHVIPCNNKSVNVESCNLPILESRKSNTPIVNQNKPENDSSLSHIKPSKNMSMKVESSMDKEDIVDMEINRRHTQVFSQNSPESDMSMTHVIPCNNKSVNVESCNLPILESRKSNTPVVNQNKPENDFSLSHIKPTKNMSMRVESSMDKEDIVDMEINRRHTQVFSQNSPESDMSMTHVIPCNNKSVNVESCNLPILESRQSNTPIVNQNKPENDSSLSHTVPGKSVSMRVESSMDKENIVEMEINRRHTQVFSQYSPESDMSMTHVIPCSNKAVNVESSNLPILESRQSHTLIVNQNKPENDSSLGHIVPSKNVSMRVESSMDKENIVEMEINKRHTQVFSQNSPESDMSMTHVNPSINKSMNSCHIPVLESRQSQIHTHIIPSDNKSMHTELNIISENVAMLESTRRHSKVLNHTKPECNISMIDVSQYNNIEPKINDISNSVLEKNGEHSLLVSQCLQENISSVRHAIPHYDKSINIDENILKMNESRTEIFTQNMPEMDFSLALSKNELAKIQSDVNIEVLPLQNPDNSQTFNLLPSETNFSMKLTEPRNFKSCHENSDSIEKTIPLKKSIIDSSNMIMEHSEGVELDEKCPQVYHPLTPESESFIKFSNTKIESIHVSNDSKLSNNKFTHESIAVTYDIALEKHNFSDNYIQKRKSVKTRNAFINSSNCQFESEIAIKRCKTSNHCDEYKEQTCHSVDLKNENGNIHLLNAMNDMFGVNITTNTISKRIDDFNEEEISGTAESIMIDTNSLPENENDKLQSEYCGPIISNLSTTLQDKVTVDDNVVNSHLFSNEQNSKNNESQKELGIEMSREISIMNFTAHVNPCESNNMCNSQNIIPSLEINDESVRNQEISINHMIVEEISCNMKSLPQHDDQISTEAEYEKINTVKNSDDDSITLQDEIHTNFTKSISPNKVVTTAIVHNSSCEETNENNEDTDHNESHANNYVITNEIVPMDVDISMQEVFTITKNDNICENAECSILSQSSTKSKNCLEEEPSLHKKTDDIEIRNISSTENNDAVSHNLSGKRHSLKHDRCIEITNSSGKLDVSSKVKNDQKVKDLSVLNTSIILSPCRKKRKVSLEVCTWLKDWRKIQSNMQIDLNPVRRETSHMKFSNNYENSKLLEDVSDISFVSNSSLEIKDSEMAEPDIENDTYATICDEEWISDVSDQISKMELNLLDCVEEETTLDEWTFLLLKQSIRLRIRFNKDDPVNFKRPITQISLENLSSKNENPYMIHMQKALKNQLQEDFLMSEFTTWNDVPDLLAYCAKISSATRFWGDQLKMLFVNYGLVQKDDLFTCKMWSGYAMSIWTITIKTDNLPFANVEDVTVSLHKGLSQLPSDSFFPIICDIKKDWDYMLNLLNSIYNFIQSLR